MGEESKPEGQPGGPGASGPGEPGYEGEATVGDEGAVGELPAEADAEAMEGEAPSG